MFPITFVVVEARTGDGGEGGDSPMKDGYARRKIKIKTLMGDKSGCGLGFI